MTVTQQKRIISTSDLDVVTAYDFYKRFMLDYTVGKAGIYAKYGFTLEGSISPKDWEVFAAILLQDKKRPGYGADLYWHEVKAGIGRGSFEYQYHKHHGLEKLEGDKSVDHVFFTHSADCKYVTTWWVPREPLIPIFDSWLPALRENYTKPERQRFRPSIPFSFVKQNGTRIMEILDGSLVFPDITQSKPQIAPRD